MIYGIQKLSLVDYPKEPALVIFLGGCNFRCPFCHNKGIVTKEFPELSEQEVFQEILERKHFINAVVVTGGEPTIYGQKLLQLLKQLRTTKLKIKLDTNGTNPELLKEIMKEQLVDYLAMDIKGTWKRYEEISGTKVDLQKIKESIYLIEESGLKYEFRTTISKKFHTASDIEEIRSYFKKSENYYLQGYQYSDQQIKDEDFEAYSRQELEQLQSQYQVKI